MIDRFPPQKSVSATDTFVTLHRDPPLTRIFAPGFLAPSSSRTERAGFRRRVKMAVARPAAPAPTIATSATAIGEILFTVLSSRWEIVRLLWAGGGWD